MPKEYWVNVYNLYGIGYVYYQHNYSAHSNMYKTSGLLYRIHVKMDGGYNRYGTAVREYKYFEKGDWIGSWGS